ncbi:bifunctional hydroxymethylpyrimidine kinase/phosphomethylpyrimidine kinase [Fontisphaera persica]|uniref:bifunctional hydroxymethylpyrimidine kinase/phosphomethylpyrimidine kinase n=1 Tax=Fontisphaera persica TaxID=2974023 RepID=UPI0024BFDC2F|nr:bifunctional hydroxymethylpyrimidine kinase/phosphomethylpyrimidine kinase [Fontisphaera persica]WCJ58490.1 bifunctional hydroxymethylpyrimidine kinase/phosphomethylpyrimidine kinase [Fontisphaera persica]
MTARQRVPVALTIAGSDSGGGAGIQADLHTFAALGVHGTTAITCLTAQNPREVKGVHPVPAAFLQQQLAAVFAELRPAAIKTGMLYSRPLIEAAVEFLAAQKNRPPLVVDPVMIATSGAALLRPEAVRALQEHLLPLAQVITPNAPEAAALAGVPVESVEDLRAVARRLQERHGCAVLVKGGHLRGLKVAVDVLFDGREEWLLEAPRVPGVSTHGTGCTYSAAITAGLARGLPLLEAVGQAKQFISQAIAHSRRIGRHQALAWGAARGGLRPRAARCGCAHPACHCGQGGVY